MIQITTLVDNELSTNKSLKNEHGLSVLIEYNDKKYLFDCGSSGDALMWNAHKLGKNIKDVDAVILSHSHYDHCAGYRDIIENGLGSRVLYTGPHFFEPKYSMNGIKYTCSFAGFDSDFLMENDIENRVVNEITKLAEGLYIVTNFPRVNTIETIPERFVKLVSSESGDNPKMVCDDFVDEICIVVRTDKGLVVLVGCSHPGICNMIEKIHDTFKEPVYAVFGGTHLVSADEERIRFTINKLKSMGLSIIGFGHCSGELAEKEIADDESVGSCHLAVGDSMIFNEFKNGL